MTAADLACGESKLETTVSYLLIIGVAISVILEVAGIILFYNNYGNLQISQDKNVFISGENFFVFIYQKVQNLFVSDNALLFMTLGIIILILTPYVRAITSFIYFAWIKNRSYVLITLFVLAVLTASLALH